MRARIVICIICIIFILQPLTIFASSKEEQWEHLDQLSEQTLQLVKQQRYTDAKNLLNTFSTEFLKVGFNVHPNSMDDLRIITVAHNNALEAVSSKSVSDEEKLNKVTQFRLVIDAINSEYQPMWTEMEDSIMTTFSHMKETITEGDSDSFSEQFEIFLSKYEIIEPSIKVDITPETIEKIDTHISFINQYKNENLKLNTRLQQLNQMENDLKDLFDRMKEDDADPSLIWVMISTGGAIILTLTYVGWRKYKGDKLKTKTQRDYDDR